MDIFTVNLERLSLSDRVAENLRTSIITGALTPGEHLAESELAQQLGVSRGALREALRTLQSEGLIQSIPARGMFVTKLDESDIAEISSLRDMLEGFAVHRAAEHATETQLADLQALFARMVQAAQAGDSPQVNELDMKFHRAIWQMSLHERLNQILNGLYSQIQAFLIAAPSLEEDLARVMTEHGNILQAIQAQDGDLAELHMQRHIASATKRLTESIHLMSREESKVDIASRFQSS